MHGWRGGCGGGGPALEVPPVEAEWTSRVPPPRRLLEHHAGRSIAPEGAPVSEQQLTGVSQGNAS